MQTVISSQDERFSVADHDVQPVQQSGVGIVRLVFVGVALQRWDVAAVAVTVDCAAIGKGKLGEFFDRCPLDVWSDQHFEVERIS